MALNAALAVAALAGVAAWRLAQGPVSLAWAVPMVEARAAALGLPVRIASLGVGWTGFRDGPDAPVSVVAGETQLGEGGAVGAVAETRATVALASLVDGDPIPHTLTLDGAKLRVSRAVDGGVTIAGLRPPDPAGPDRAGLLPRLPDGLRTVRLRDFAIEFTDAGSGLAAQASGGSLDLERDGAGAWRGKLQATLKAGGRDANLDVLAAPATGGGTVVRAKLTPLNPAALAGMAPATAALSMFDLPVTLSATASLGPSLAFQRAHLEATAGPGVVHAGTGTLPVVSFDLALDATGGGVEANVVRLVTAPNPDGPRTTILGHAKAVPTDKGFAVATGIDLDRVAFADLPAIWPPGVGGPGTRPWVVKNVTAGTASNGHVEADLTVAPDFSTVALTRIDGRLDGHDVTVSWLAPVPPLVHGEVRLTVTDPDVIDVAVLAAQQSGTGVHFDGSNVRLTGIAGNNQFAAIQGPIVGPVPDVIRVLSHPRLKLLSKSPVPLSDTAGQLRGTIAIAHLPLRDVSLDDLGIVADARLANVRIGKLVAGRDLDQGQLTLHATTDGLDVAGTAAVARVPARLSVAMDFAAGPPSQVQETAHVAATLDPVRLKRLGIDVGTLLTGSFGIDADARVRRDGRTEVVARADLTNAGFGAAPLPWRKDAGHPATGDASLTLDRDGSISLHHFIARGPGLDVDAATENQRGGSLVRLRRLRLGTAVDLAGTVALPTGAGGGYVIDVAGPTLDLTGVRKALAGTGTTSKGGSPTPFVATAKIDHVTLGDGRALLGVAAHVERGAEGVRDVELSGATVGPPASPFHLSMHPTPSGRRIEAHTDDLGAVLAGLGVFDGIGGGRLKIVGVPKLDAAGRPSTVGVVTLDALRLRDAPWAARLLKALTLYGVVDLLRGPGVGVTRATAPFELQGDVLTLRDARAVSPSLGVTAKGQIDLGRELVAMRGTVVPAYLFNTIPGRLPLIGRAFSPERGGGLLSAMFSLRGKLSDPAIMVNPLSLLTPGALRGLFDGFSAPTLDYDPETKLSSQ